MAPFFIEAHSCFAFQIFSYSFKQLQLCTSVCHPGEQSVCSVRRLREGGQPDWSSNAWEGHTGHLHLCQRKRGFFLRFWMFNSTPLPERSLRSRVSSFLVWSASASLSITLLKGRPLSLKLSLVLSSRQKPPLPASICVRSGVTRTAVSSVTCDTMALTGVCSSLSLCCPLSGSSSFLEETIFNLPLVAGNYFRLRGPKISVTRTRLCHCSVEAAGARTSTLCMDTGMWISETFHISWNIVLVVIFPTI